MRTSFQTQPDTEPRDRLLDSDYPRDGIIAWSHTDSHEPRHRDPLGPDLEGSAVGSGAAGHDLVDRFAVGSERDAAAL